MADTTGEHRLYETLGRIQATLEANGRDTERFREELKDEVRAVAAAAEASRQQIHQDLSVLSARVTAVEFKVRDVGLMAEDTRNRVSLVAPTVQEHEDIKHTASGVTIALKHMGKVIYLTGAAFLAMVGTTIAYIYHLIESGGGMHPK